jgi:hypothetical protein
MNMETINKGTIEQMDLILRLNKFHSKRVKVKLCDGSLIEGWLTGLQPAITMEEFDRGDWLRDFKSKECYLRGKYGTITISLGKIADLEHSA